MNVIELAQSWFGEELLSPRNVATVVWSGLVLLTIALIVVMRTNWGQAKPLSKCIALSIFAHVLFLTYAYGTRLIFDEPAPFDEQFMRLAVISGADDVTVAPRAEQKRPWDDFAVDQAISPDVDSPVRQSQDDAVTVDNPVVPAPVLSNELPIPAEQIETTQPLPAPTPSVVPAPTEVMPSDVEIEVPEQEVAEPAESPVPGDIVSAPALPEMAVPEPAPLLEQVNHDDVGEPSLTSIDDVATVAESRIGQEDVTLVATTAVMPDGVSSPPVPATLPMTAVRPIDSTPPISRQLDQTTLPERVRLGDGGQLPTLYRLRAEEDRLSWVEQRGGSERTERAVQAALSWLAENQQQDGRWDSSRHGGGQEKEVLGHDRGGAGAEADTGITGLALLAFLGAGHTHFEGEFRRNVQHGLEFLVARQARSGDLSGDARLFAKMYCHGIASLALSEAYAMTGDHRLREPVERAVRYTVASQDPVTGGWRYQPGDRGDMSQFGWQVMALKSAEAAGVPIASETRARMLKFMASATTGRHGGLASYRPGDGPSRTMTAEALACRYFLGETPYPAAIGEAADYITAQLPADGKANLYYWYYGTLSMFQIGDERWDGWNRAMQTQLLRRQLTLGTQSGSWDPDTVWGTYGGRVYSTAMATLCLEVYYRYLTVHDGQ